MTLIEAIAQFLKHLLALGRSPETIRTYKGNLSRFHSYMQRKSNSQVFVEDITADHFEEYLKEELDVNQFTSAYRFNVITAFKCLFGYCYKKGYSKTNIARQVKQIKRRVKERTYLTETEFQKLISEINHKVINLVIQTLYYAGLRINECIHLTLEDVDFEMNSITVREDKEQQTRIVPINYKLRAELLNYLENIRRATDSDRFFTTRTGTLSPGYTNLILREAAEKAGINKPISCHILRHSFASNLILKGVDIYKVQKLLGHTNLKSTSIYLHANMNELRNAVEQIR